MFGGLKNKIVKALALRWMRGKVESLRGKDKETTMGKVLKFLDGWKLVIAVVALAGVNAWDQAHNGHAGNVVAIILSLLGYTPGADWLVIARDLGTHGLAIVAILHKLVKAQRQVKAGSSVSGTLSTEGYVRKYVDDVLAAPAAPAPIDTSQNATETDIDKAAADKANTQKP